MESVLAELAIDHKLLTERVKGHLAGLPASGLYRDARTERETSERLGILMDRAGARRIITLARPVTIEQLGRAACSLPSLVAPCSRQDQKSLPRQARLPTRACSPSHVATRG